MGIELFLKLPDKFFTETLVGTYTPRRFIVKHDNVSAIEPRDQRCQEEEFLKLRTFETNKIRCGEKHFQALGMPFDIRADADGV